MCPSVKRFVCRAWSICAYMGANCSATRVAMATGSALALARRMAPRSDGCRNPGGHVSGANYNPAVTLAVWLRGKCANCAAPISPRYFAVELLTGEHPLADEVADGVEGQIRVDGAGTEAEQQAEVVRLERLTRLHRLVEFVGRWSMLDVFVVALLAALVRAGALAGGWRQRLALGTPKRGMRSYLAISGGITVPEMLGS